MARYKIEFEVEVEGDMTMEYVAAAASDLMMNEALEFTVVAEDGEQKQFNTEDYA